MEDERPILKTHDLDYIASQIIDHMQTSFTIPSKVHKDHHNWVEVRIIEEKDRKETYLQLQRDILKWVVIGVLTTIMTAIGAGLYHFAIHWSAN